MCANGLQTQIGQGRDARNLPDAQPVEEVCDIILDVIQVRLMLSTRRTIAVFGATHARLASPLDRCCGISCTLWALVSSLLDRITYLYNIQYIYKCGHTQSPRAEAYTKKEHAVMVANYFSGAF